MRTALTDKEFKKTVHRFIDKNRTFSELHVGSVKTLYFNGKSVCRATSSMLMSKDNFKASVFRNFLSLFNKNLFKQLREVNGLNELKIKRLTERTVYCNMDEWKNYPLNEYVYEFDIKSAYWQTAYLLGYIDRQMFERYYNDPDSKMYKRLCFSFLARKKYLVHHFKGVSHEIVCDNTILKRVYDNVRIALSNNVYSAVKELDTFLKYNVDAIYVDLNNASKVHKSLKDMGYDFHFRVWKKIDETHIQNSKQIKKL